MWRGHPGQHTWNKSERYIMSRIARWDMEGGGERIKNDSYVQLGPWLEPMPEWKRDIMSKGRRLIHFGTGGVRAAVGCSGNSTYTSGARERGVIMNRDSWMGSGHMAIAIQGGADTDSFCSYDRIFGVATFESK